MNQKFEDILKEKYGNRKVTPSSNLDKLITSEIKRFSLYTKLISLVKSAAIITIASVAILGIMHMFPSQKETVTQQPTSYQSPQKSPSQTLQTPHPAEKLQPKPTENISTISKNIPTHTISKETNRKDTIICQEEITINNKKLSWDSPQDNILLSKKGSQTDIIIAQPGIYKLYGTDANQNIKDSIVLLALFAHPHNITTCKDFVELKNEFVKYSTSPDNVKSNNIKLRKNKTGKRKFTVYVSALGHTQIDYVTVNFMEKPHIKAKVTPIAANKYNIELYPENVDFYYHNRKVTELRAVEEGTYTISAHYGDCDTVLVVKTDKSQYLYADFYYVQLENRAGIPIYFNNKTTYQGYKAITYRWNFGDGTLSNDKNPKHTYMEAGQYTIELTATSEDGTTSTAKKTLVILPPDKKNQPNVFTPNGDGKNDIFKIQLPIKLNDFKCEIYTRSGRKIYEFNNPEQGWNGKIDNNDASEGVYYYIVTGTQEDGKPFVEKSFLYLYR